MIIQNYSKEVFEQIFSEVLEVYQSIEKEDNPYLISSTKLLELYKKFESDQTEENYVRLVLTLFYHGKHHAEYIKRTEEAVIYINNLPKS